MATKLSPARLRTKAFTLIELMIVVGIIGLLASIALPRYQLSILRTRQAEASLMLSIIRTAQFTNLASQDCFANLAKNPPITPTPLPQFWSFVGTAPTKFCPPTATYAFEDLSVRPNGVQTYFQYACAARGSTPGVTDDFSCSAYGDLDGDGAYFEEVYCTDLGNTGTCLPSPYGTVSLFPNDMVRVSAGIY